jgi:molybdate transport system regulatory protein
MTNPLRASVALSGDDMPSVGHERIRLLEAVARAGSISAGAREAGMSYKGAWDALAAMANLFGGPLLVTQAGGRSGGGAHLTPRGQAVVTAFNRLEGELSRALGAMERDLAGTGVAASSLLGGFMLRTSARNVLRGSVAAIRTDALSAEVSVAVTGQTTIHAHITVEGLADLGVAVGRDVLVLVKANFVTLAAAGEAARLSVRNRIPGRVARCEVSDVAGLVTLDIGGGRTLTASVTAESVEALGLVPGKAAEALFDANRVILAVD